MTRRPVIDWDAARNHYLALGPTRTFRAVADKFGVSAEIVGRHARAKGWDDEARRLDTAALRRVDEELVLNRAKRLANHLRVIDLASAQVLADLEAGKKSVDLSDYPALVKLEQLLLGEPTDRIEVREVREVVIAILTAQDSALQEILVAQDLEAPKRQAVVAAFRERTQEALGRVDALGAAGEPAA